MIANNDEAKRSKIWTVVTAVTSADIVYAKPAAEAA